MLDVDTKLFRSLLCVAAEQSFSVAARRLDYSQATMSLHIRTLEGKLGARLLNRSPHSVTLTAEGRRLLPEIQELVDLHDRVIGCLQSGPVYGEVRLGMAGAFAASLLPGLLKYVAQEHPAVDLDVDYQPSGSLGQMIEARILDLAVVSLPQEDPSALVLRRPRLHWVASPDFRLAGPAPIPVAWGEKDCPFRAAGTAELVRRRIESREVLEASDQRTVEAAVAAGIAVTVMPEGTVPDTLAVLSPSSAFPPLGRAVIQLLERPGQHPEAVEAVKHKIVEAYRDPESRLSRETAGT